MLGPKNLRTRFVILISGQGTNMQAIVRACLSGACAADVVAVISSHADSAGLTWAAQQGISIVSLPYTNYDSRQSFDDALASEINHHMPDYVLLAGFMRVLTADFVQQFQGKMVNIHPSLLPAFPGLHTHKQAHAAGVQAHGCTVHFVTPTLDYGPIIAQGLITVTEHDTPETLAKKVLKIEHFIYPQVASWLAQGRVYLTSDFRVQVDKVAKRLFFAGK